MIIHQDILEYVYSLEILPSVDKNTRNFNKSKIIIINNNRVNSFINKLKCTFNIHMSVTYSPCLILKDWFYEYIAHTNLEHLKIYQKISL